MPWTQGPQSHHPSVSKTAVGKKNRNYEKSQPEVMVIILYYVVVLAIIMCSARYLVNVLSLHQSLALSATLVQSLRTSQINQVQNSVAVFTSYSVHTSKLQLEDTVVVASRKENNKNKFDAKPLQK